MSNHKRRKYRMKARAERQRQTRERIVAATAALHREIGPARTTIADIARRARVQRLTVYNTFPTIRDLFAACQSRFLTESPLPDLAPQPGVAPLSGLEDALVRLYAWYRTTKAMEKHVHRDRHLVPALDELMAKTGDVWLAAIAEAHAAAIAQGVPSPPLRSLLRLALAFGTWELLSDQRLTDDEIARLMMVAARAVSAQQKGRA